MEVVAATPNSNGVPPFHNHDVHEWSRIDSLSGVLERARLETDHWAASTNNSSHNYGKVVDTRARSNADGAIQQARRQLEVFQSSVPGGRLQVIKSHTVSSSRWTSKPTVVNQNKDTHHFTDLELPLNPLDLTSQKSRATVGRSVGRRPPSRARSRDETQSNNRQTFSETHSTETTNLRRISRLCNQVHENAVKQTFGKYHKPPIHERESGDGVEIVEIESTNNENTNDHTNLIRTKSTSSENIHLTPEKEKQKKSVEDLEDLEQLQNWRRTSKIRRSLQFPAQTKTSTTKPLDVPINTGSVRKIREDLETGRRLNTALRGNNVDLEALDQILQLITSPTEVNGDNRFEEPEKDEQITSKKLKRHSFVTVESLQEVRGRLRRTSSPVENVYTPLKTEKDEEADDGIVTEDSLSKHIEEMPALDSTSSHSRVRTYVYGMEALINRKPILGTGSLESRPSRQLNGTSINRNEDWYNRRKSYGFEQVHSQSPTNTISKNMNFMDSSTDSGICRSSEIMLVPTTNKNNIQLNKSNDLNDSQKDELFNRINKYSTQNENGVSNIGSVKRYASIFEQKKSSPLMRDYEGTKITIPIVSDGSPDNYTPFSYNRNGNSNEVKRHSIAVDESKYVTQSASNIYRRTSLAVNDKTVNDAYDPLDDDLSQGKKHKKVEFCKTEVHFAVDSGRVNIVTTDEKPPPTNNFRRRRRNSATLYNNLLNDANKNGLPVLHFGDSSYEKSMFNFTDPEDEINLQDLQITDSDRKLNDQLPNGNVTVSTNQSYHNYGDDAEEEQRESTECEIPKSILKNKPVKPKPYLLGDDPYCIDTPLNDDKKIWGVKLKPVHSSLEPQMWKSTVTLKNTLYDKNRSEQKDLLVSPNEIKENPSDNIRIISSQLNSKCPVEDLRKPELKGYSTKVNIGSGEAVVIEGSLNINQMLTEVKKEPFIRTSTMNSSPTFTEKQNRKIKIINKTPNSPVILRKTICDSKKQELKVNYVPEKLSSPSLVGLTKVDSVAKVGGWKKGNPTDGSSTMSKLWGKRSPTPKVHTYDTLHVSTTQRKSHTPSPTIENVYCTIKDKDSDVDSETQASPNRSVLRNPRRSEMAYFGVKIPPSPKSFKKTDAKPLVKNNIRTGNAYLKPRAKSPIYENVEEIKRTNPKSPTKQFDSSILDELTKAADQILQAVNGYAEEAEKESLEEQKKNYKKEKLDTISETKSWKQKNVTKHNCSEKTDLAKPKLRHTSSTSSIDSVTESKKTALATNQRNVVDSDKYKKKSGSDTSSTRAATKARRLQRASSREALLQSHGSSSEDLPVSIDIPLRKSRVIRKTKSSQVTDTHSVDSKSKRHEEKGKSEERVHVGALPTIRHKTAISTIRSTAEKAQSRERSNRSKNEDTRKKGTLKKEPSRSSGTKSDRNTHTSSREAITHRISTAYVPLYRRRKIETNECPCLCS